MSYTEAERKTNPRFSFLNSFYILYGQTQGLIVRQRKKPEESGIAAAQNKLKTKLE